MTAMAFSKSKSLLQTQNPISLFMMLIFFLLLLNNVKSQTFPSPSPLSNSETVGFGFSSFGPQPVISPIDLHGDASIASGALQLTKKDKLGNPIKNSVGRAQYVVPVHLWDRASGKLADFSSGFTFVMSPKGSRLHGDGLAFFQAPIHSKIAPNSNGGYLGLFSPQTALNSSSNQIVAIEFDTHRNEWDPTLDSFDSSSNHIGIDINSIRSAIYAEVPYFGETTASINYNGESKSLSVLISSKSIPNRTTEISYDIDLRTVLPEWIKVGFSASTGEYVETHDILAWSFEAAL